MKKLLFIALLISASTIFSQEKKDVKLSGLAYFEYFNNIDSRFDTLVGAHGFRFKRIFLTVDYILSENLSFRSRLESDGVILTSEATNRLSAFIKDLSFKLKLFKNTYLIAGLIPTPMTDIEESFWEYRSAEKIQMDYRSIISTRDAGFAIRGSDNSSKFNYWLSVGNFSSHGVEKDKFKTLYTQFSYDPLKELDFTLDFYYASQAMDKNILIGRFGTYSKIKGVYSAGASVLVRNWQKKVTDNSDLKSLGFSVFGNVNLLKNLKTFGRVDYWDPNISGTSKDDYELTLFYGLDYEVEKGLNLVPHIEYNKYELTSLRKDVSTHITLVYNF